MFRAKKEKRNKRKKSSIIKKLENYEKTFTDRTESSCRLDKKKTKNKEKPVLRQTEKK